MQAVIQLNGKQYAVEEGRYVKVDLLPNAEGDVITINNVLMVLDGEASLLGAPFVEGASVMARVRSHGRDAKILVYKMRCKKGYRRKNGHRQGFSYLSIEELLFPGKKATQKEDTSAAADKPAKKAASKEQTTAKKEAASA